ncbi:MAG: hypothetical protein IJX05_02760, partial [Clostridia bacterium]|nr:hypothetical protein [Clostridia bacterium]
RKTNRRKIKMSDFRATLETFKDIKEIKDLLDDVDKLRALYYYNRFEEMKRHIFDLTNKYFIERVLWNTANRNNMPAEDDYRQQFINAENFLIIQGFKKLNELRKDWRKALTEDEITLIESIIKSME